MASTRTPEVRVEKRVVEQPERDLLEIKEAERKALLLADRNPEPPEKQAELAFVSEKDSAATLEEQVSDKPLNDLRTVNGAFEKTQRLSESSDGGSSSPKSQVRFFFY